MLRVGLIGCGRIGQVHLEALSSIQGVLVAMCSDVSSSTAEQAAARFGVKQHTTRPSDVLSSDAVDAVWICSPSSLHTEQIVEAAKNGKHIFAEKPLALSLEEADLAIEAVRIASVELMVGFNRRFDPDFAALQASVAAGAVGEPLSVTIHSRDPAPPPVDYVRGGGGLFSDMTIHDLDMARFLLTTANDDDGSITGGVKSVYATGRCAVDPSIVGLAGSEAIDTATVLLEFDSGATATIENCRSCAFGYDQRVEVFGTGGNLQLPNRHGSGVNLWRGSGVGRLDMPYTFFMDRYADAYRAETVAFSQRLLARQSSEGGNGSRAIMPAVPTGEDGKLALVLAEACDLSLAERRVVDVNEVLPSWGSLN